jgi:hypothetical protein
MRAGLERRIKKLEEVLPVLVAFAVLRVALYLEFDLRISPVISIAPNPGPALKVNVPSCPSGCSAALPPFPFPPAPSLFRAASCAAPRPCPSRAPCPWKRSASSVLGFGSESESRMWTVSETGSVNANSGGACEKNWIVTEAGGGNANDAEAESASRDAAENASRDAAENANGDGSGVESANGVWSANDANSAGAVNASVSASAARQSATAIACIDARPLRHRTPRMTAVSFISHRPAFK